MKTNVNRIICQEFMLRIFAGLRPNFCGLWGINESQFLFFTLKKPTLGLLGLKFVEIGKVYSIAESARVFQSTGILVFSLSEHLYKPVKNPLNRCVCTICMC